MTMRGGGKEGRKKRRVGSSEGERNPYLGAAQREDDNQSTYHSGCNRIHLHEGLLNCIRSILNIRNVRQSKH